MGGQNRGGNIFQMARAGIIYPPGDDAGENALREMVHMSHDPIYDPDNMELWVFRIIALVILALALGLIFAGAVKASGNTPGEAPPAPPPELQETRTQVETGRMICQRWGDKGCAEWRIYRTTSY